MTTRPGLATRASTGRPARADAVPASGTNAIAPNRYGQFAPDARSFAITDPSTPMPWVNVVSNGRFGFVVSQRGGGFSWLDDAQHNVLTRWEMDLVRDDRGKFLYLADLDTDEIWSCAPAPCNTPFDHYVCEHSVGRTRFQTAYAGIETEWTLFVTPDAQAEVWLVTVRNSSGRPRRLRIASYLEWCCGAAPDSKREFHRLFLRTRYDSARGAIFAGKTMWDLPGGGDRLHWNRPWPYAAAHAAFGEFDAPFAIADKETFAGRYQQPARPLGLLRPASVGEGAGESRDAIAAIGGDLCLSPDEQRTLHFVLACDESEECVLGALDSLHDTQSARDALRRSDQWWEDQIGDDASSSDCAEFDALASTWLPYQAISGRLFARTGYYQQSGAFGFRDQLQDSQVWLARDPQRCLAHAHRASGRQFADGSVQHWWHELADFGLKTACSDDYLWLPFVVANYLRETGRFEALDAPAPFLDHGAPAPLIDHCLRAIELGHARRSERGLPLIGSCDWNDGLSATGIEGRGESVWLAFFQIDVLDDWTRVLRARGLDERAAELDARRSGLFDAVNTHAWDGAWFRRATRDDGSWLGSSGSDAGRIYLNPQVWAVMTQGSTPERLDAAWSSVKRELLTEYGPLLLAPAYATPDESIGYITRYPKGGRENGGVYTHAATWALAAACKRREAETVASIWRSLSPVLRSGRDADTYSAEPYVLPGNSDGPTARVPGRAGWTWYTGSAAWLSRIATEWMLGIRPCWDGLRIDPCPPAFLGETVARRMWRGSRVVVRFDAGAFNPDADPHVSVNGTPISGGVIPPCAAEESDELDIHVEWPAP